MTYAETQSHSSTPIMYVVRTSSKFYETRLKYLLSTWITLVKNHTYFITEKNLPNISHDHVIITGDLCGEERHTMGTLCCKTAHDFKAFRQYKTNYDWFCHFDDDQYVHTSNLEKYLSTLDPNLPHYIGRNSWTKPLQRRKKPFPYPFWFGTLGAGVCLSKYLIDLLEPYTNNVSQFVNGCLKENYHDDIYLGFLISACLNVSLTKNYRFHSHLEKDFYKNKRTFLETFTKQITFGFRAGNYYPNFLPSLYTSNLDRFRLLTLHCLLNSHLPECRAKILHQISNVTD